MFTAHNVALLLLVDYKRFQGGQVGFLEMVRNDLRIAQVVGGRVLDAQEVGVH